VPICCFVFCSTGFWTQGFTLAMQVLYLFNHVPSPFYFSYFSGRVWCFCQGWPVISILPISHSKQLRLQVWTTAPGSSFFHFCFLSYLLNLTLWNKISFCETRSRKQKEYKDKPPPSPPQTHKRTPQNRWSVKACWSLGNQVLKKCWQLHM
jgi:hypothetical protein